MTENIHNKINQRAIEQPLGGRKAIRGTGEGFWSADARIERTEQHYGNWMRRGENAVSRVKTGHTSPYEPSALHRRRTSRTVPSSEGSMENPIGISGIAFDASMHQPGPEPSQ